MSELLFDGVEFKVEVGFSTSTGGPNTVPYNGLASDIVWTDVSDHVREVTIQRGRSNELDSFTTGSASIVLSNADRHFDPEHVPYVTLPGTSGNFLSGGEINAWPSAGDLSVRVKVKATNLATTSFGAFCGNTNQISTGFRFFTGNGVARLGIAWWDTGTGGFRSVVANADNPTTTDIIWVRVDVDRDNGAGGNDVWFYYSTDGITWTLIGTKVTTATVATPGYNGALGQSFGLGSQKGDSSLNGLSGNYYQAVVYTDLTETTKVVDYTATGFTSNTDSTMVASTGETWTLNKSGASPATVVSGPYYGTLTPMRPIRVSATPPGGSIQSMFVGFVDGWPQTYSPPNDSVVVVSCSDAFKVLALTPLQSKWVDTVVADTPRSWLRLNETSGASTISDTVDDYVADSMAGVASGPFDRNDGFYYSDGLYTTTTGAQSESLVPSDTSDFSQQFDGIRWAQCENPRIFGSPVNYRGQYFAWPPLGVEMVFEIDADIPTGDTYGLCAFGITGYLSCAAYVSISGGATPGFIYLYCLILNTGFTIAVHSQLIGHIDNPAARGPRLLNFGRTSGGSTVANIDDVSVPYSTFFTKDPSINWYGWTVGHCYSTGSATYTAAKPFKGKIDEVVLYDNVLDSARITEHNEVFESLPGVTSDVQIGQILDDIGAPVDARVLDAGLSTLQRYIPSGDALSYIQKIAEAEQGRFYVRADGALTFRTRNSLNTYATYNTTQLSLTDSEYVDFKPNFTDQLIKNEVSITRDGGVPIIRSSPLSQGQYWLRPESLSGLLNNESTTISYMAEARLQAYRFPLPRVDAVSIMPRGCGLWDEAIGFDIGTRIETTRSPQGVGSPIVQTAIIEGIQHSITPSNWQTTWLLSPSEVTDFLVLDNPELDKVGDASARLGY